MPIAFLLIVLLVCGCAAPAIADTDGRIEVREPILIIYQASGEKRLRFSATPPPGYTVDHYGKLIVGVVKIVAGGYKVSEAEVWSAVERAKLGDQLSEPAPPRR